MPRYSVTGAVHGSTWIGEYDANTPEEAIELAYNDAGVSLCHECARSVSDPEVCELTAEDVETGDSTSEATTNDQIVEQAEEIRRLRAAAKQAREALRDCLRSDSTNRLVDVIGDAMTALEQVGVKP
jgi:hypothetical protein